MFELLPETKVMRDPIHGYIHVDLKLIWDLIDTSEFQRLRRIHQLGGTYMVYHTAEHSRFSHSLGVYEIVRRMVHEIKSIREALNEYERVTVMLAALLHDVGHGPFSHAFEAISGKHHEEFTVRMILEETQLHELLAKADKSLPQTVADVILHKHPNPLLSQLVSSQLDADRMDYLLRDSYFTGTSYGKFDLERVLRTLRVSEQKLVVKESGIHTIEDYIMSRYHMYWQVYFHPISRSYEAMLTSLFQRLRDLYEMDSALVEQFAMFYPMFQKNDMSVQDYLMLDEPCALYGIQLMSRSDDPVLRDLARRILTRDLFAREVIESKEQVRSKKEQLIAAGYDPVYYFKEDHSTQIPYHPYVSKGSDVIEVQMEHGDIVELSAVSTIVSSIVQGKIKDDYRMFYVKL